MILISKLPYSDSLSLFWTELASPMMNLVLRHSFLLFGYLDGLDFEQRLSVIQASGCVLQGL